MRRLPMRCLLLRIVGFQRAIEVDRRTVSTTVLAVGERPIVGQPDAAKLG